MKSVLVHATAILALTLSLATAGEAEGVIEKVDATAMTLTFSDGETYALPEAFDASLIGEGMKVVIAYDETDERKLITDMQQVD